MAQDVIQTKYKNICIVEEIYQVMHTSNIKLNVD